PSPPLFSLPARSLPSSSPLSLHDALPIYLYLPSIGFCWLVGWAVAKLWRKAQSEPRSAGKVLLRQGLTLGLVVVGCLCAILTVEDRKSTRLNSSHVAISYAVFCLKKKNKK